jgi:hypothetical protein
MIFLGGFELVKLETIGTPLEIKDSLLRWNYLVHQGSV